jgi:hypothetical protein
LGGMDTDTGSPLCRLLHNGSEDITVSNASTKQVG